MIFPYLCHMHLRAPPVEEVPGDCDREWVPQHVHQPARRAVVVAAASAAVPAARALLQSGATYRARRLVCADGAPVAAVQEAEHLVMATAPCTASSPETLLTAQKRLLLRV